MSLLEELQSQPELFETAPPWALLQRMLPKLVPGLTVRKMEVFNTGSVVVSGQTPLARTGKFHYAARLDAGSGTGPREIRLGVSRYRDEATQALSDGPYVGMVDALPGAVTAWLAATMLSHDIMDLIRPPQT